MDLWNLRSTQAFSEAEHPGYSHFRTPPLMGKGRRGFCPVNSSAAAVTEVWQNDKLLRLSSFQSHSDCFVFAFFSPFLYSTPLPTSQPASCRLIINFVHPANCVRKLPTETTIWLQLAVQPMHTPQLESAEWSEYARRTGLLCQDVCRRKLCRGIALETCF